MFRRIRSGRGFQFPKLIITWSAGDSKGYFVNWQIFSENPPFFGEKTAPPGRPTNEFDIPENCIYNVYLVKQIQKGMIPLANSKVMSVAEAIGKYCFDGMTVLLPGFVNVGVSEVLIEGLIAAGVKDLSVISNNTAAMNAGGGSR